MADPERLLLKKTARWSLRKMTPNLKSLMTILTRKKRAVLSKHQGNSNSSKTPMTTKKMMTKKRRKKDRGMSTAMNARMVETSCAVMAVTRWLTITALASRMNLRATGSARIA